MLPIYLLNSDNLKNHINYKNSISALLAIGTIKKWPVRNVFVQLLQVDTSDLGKIF